MSLRPSTTALGVSLALLVAVCSLFIHAAGQSGRRQAKPPSVVPVPTPTPEPTPTPKAKTDKDEIIFLVATGDRATNISRYPLTYHDAARNGCAERLRKGSSATVDISQRDLSRGEAIAKAKADNTSYVVLVSLIEDTMSASSGSGYVELEVDYVVFAPGTAKVVANGRTYENSHRAGPLSVPRPRGSTFPTYREKLLRKAGEDAADKILKALHLNSQPRR